MRSGRRAEAAAPSDAAGDAGDAGVDVARAPGSVTDSGFIVTSSEVGINCVDIAPSFGDGGTVMCPVPSTKCCIGVPDSRCEAPDASGSCSISYECDGPEDCTGGANCRGALDSGRLACAPGFQERDRCHETAQCAAGYVCCQIKLILDDGGYAPKPEPGDPTYLGYTNGVCFAEGANLDAWRCDR